MTIRIFPTHNFTYDGTSVNVFHANKGEGLPKHEHTFAHATFCAAGSFVVRKEKREMVVVKETQPINLKENEWHEIEALENETVFINVFS